MATDITAMDNFTHDNQSETEQSEIQKFYNDTTVFLTGATGFVGTLILEKLLRTCSGVKKVYVLIRQKKGKSTEERLKDLFDNCVFDVLKKEQPNCMEKISMVIGDCLLPNLGITEEFKEVFKNEVNIVIHSAATVRFDAHLRIALNINILALQDLLKLSLEMKNFKSFVHISTAYSNCTSRKVVDEVFYESSIDGNSLKNVVNSLNDEYITKITPMLLGEWPNTYAMTKAIAENEVLNYSKGLPIGIIRPSMITGTDHEPIPGWINNFYGPTGIVLASGIGLMRCMHADPNKAADIIPGDYVSNAVLACAWDIHNKWKEHENINNKVNAEIIEDKPFLPPIYNFVSSTTNLITWGEFSRVNFKSSKGLYSKKSIYKPFIFLIKGKYKISILWFLLHILPAIIVDSIAKFIGKKPRLLDVYTKLNKFVDVIAYFSLSEWTFYDNNTRSLVDKMSKLDQSLFRCNIAELNWEDYFRRFLLGIRIHILKDPIETLKDGCKRHKKLKLIHNMILFFLSACFLLMVYGLFLLFLR